MKIRQSTLAALLLLLLAPASFAESLRHHCPSGDWQKKLVIDLLAVGQGDSTFIRTPAGTTILIDGGNPGRGGSDIIPTLKQCYQIEALDYVILTHPHADHFGGLVETLASLPVKKAIYDTGDFKGSGYHRYEVAAESRIHRRIPPLGEGAIQSGDGVKFSIVAVNGQVLGGKNVTIPRMKNGEPKDKNAVSIALLIRFGKFSYFTGGDLTGGGRNTPDLESPVADVVGEVTVAKSDHHGSATANNSYFLSKLHPKHILISIGDGETNRGYHLPNSDTMARLNGLPFIQHIYQTAKGEGRAPASVLKKVTNAAGDIVLIAGPNSYSINGDKYELGSQIGEKP